MNSCFKQQKVSTAHVMVVGCGALEFVKREGDNPTIGLLICKDMDRTEVQLAFQGITTPMGVATYDNVKIKEIQEHLPTAEQIQQQIAFAEEEYKMQLAKKG